MVSNQRDEIVANGIALLVGWLWLLLHRQAIQMTLETILSRSVSSVRNGIHRYFLSPYRSEISRCIGLLLLRTPFTCDICCLELGGHDLDTDYKTTQCYCEERDAMYCFQCVSTFLEQQITDAQASNLVCLNGRQCCLDDRFVRKRLSKRVLSLLDRNQIANATLPENEKLWRCPSPDCNFVGLISSRTRNTAGASVFLSRFIFLSKVSRDNRMVRCPACLISSCQFCQKAWTRGVADHTGISCSAYAKKFDSSTSDRSFDSWKSKKYHQVHNCPRCASLIEKSEGCNHMTCRCGHEFCFVCGEEWTAQHSYFCQRYRRNDNRPGLGSKIVNFLGGWF